MYSQVEVEFNRQHVSEVRMYQVFLNQINQERVVTFIGGYYSLCYDSWQKRLHWTQSTITNLISTGLLLFGVQLYLFQTKPIVYLLNCISFLNVSYI